MCKPLKNDVVPTMDNVVSRDATGCAELTAPATTTTTSTNVTNNTLKININGGSVSDLTAEQKRSIIEAVSKLGMPDVAQNVADALFGTISRQPHNTRVVIEEHPQPKIDAGYIEELQRLVEKELHEYLTQLAATTGPDRVTGAPSALSAMTLGDTR
jgi:phenylpyruvate tautomerase PptA (4-oxalocrotonate tautomerase family)